MYVEVLGFFPLRIDTVRKPRSICCFVFFTRLRYEDEVLLVLCALALVVDLGLCVGDRGVEGEAGGLQLGQYFFKKN